MSDCMRVVPLADGFVNGEKALKIMKNKCCFSRKSLECYDISKFSVELANCFIFNFILRGEFLKFQIYF